MFGGIVRVSSHQVFAFQQCVLRNVTTGFISRRNIGGATANGVDDDLSTAKPYEDIPGPKPLPIIGNAWRFLPGIGTYEFLT